MGLHRVQRAHPICPVCIECREARTPSAARDCKTPSRQPHGHYPCRPFVMRYANPRFYVLKVVSWPHSATEVHTSGPHSRSTARHGDYPYALTPLSEGVAPHLASSAHEQVGVNFLDRPMLDGDGDVILGRIWCWRCR